MSQQQQLRQFTTSPAIIRHLIESQAGTLAKAISEAVSNAIDAGASRVDITLDNNGFTVADNGSGIASEDEIIRCFEQFGFEHNDRHRDHGKFGLGRGQAWAFAATVWRTHQFSLDVDIRERGLQYLLNSGLPDEAGLSIHARFYEQRTEVQLHRDRLELEELVRFAQVPVFLNGTRISKDVGGQKWDLDTDTAYLRVSDDYRLAVYSQGILVREYSRSTTGVGGVLVTKVGHPLALNMARNDVLTGSCPLWKSLLRQLQKVADETAGKKTQRTTAQDRDFFASRLWNRDGLAMFEKDLFTLTDGRHLSLAAVAKRCAAGALLTTAPTGHRVAERAIRTGQAVVLAPATLRRFGVTTPSALLTKLAARANDYDVHSADARDDARWRWELSKINRVEDDIEQCAFFHENECTTLAEKDLSAAARSVFAACSDMVNTVAYACSSKEVQVKARRMLPGRSESCEAWTDGSSTIWINETILERTAKSGLAGFLNLAHLLVHEYLHDDEDAGSHEHGMEFYEAFHNLTLDEGDALFRCATTAFDAFYRAAARKSAALAKQADRMARSASNTVRPAA